MRRALVVGIDDYPTCPLAGCVNDASAIAPLLEWNGDGSPNFSVRSLLSSEGAITSATLSDAIEGLFEGEAETVLFYFAGHGLINPESNTGYLVSQDGAKGAWGYSLGEILSIANRAHARIRSTVIILDSCHSGSLGEVPAAGSDSSIIGKGVTILTATSREGTAAEKGGRGVFTDLLLDGLAGGSADVQGQITPASLYSHVDQALGPWEQRPVYKANVQHFVTLRQITPKVPLDVLRRLPDYFPDPTFEFQLDPSFEPDRNHVSDAIKAIPVDDANARVFLELQACNRQGLIVPVGADNMFDAAIGSKACRLTALGAHYRRLAEAKRI
jgi:hypothetical protein